MTLVPLPGGSRILLIPGDGGAWGEVRTLHAISTVMPFPCRPRRLVIPQMLAIDFTIVGVAIRRGSFLGHKEVERGPWWAIEHSVPAYVFSEAFKDLNVDIDLPALRAGDEVVIEICNDNPAQRRFAGGWLVEPMTDK